MSTTSQAAGQTVPDSLNGIGPRLAAAFATLISVALMWGPACALFGFLLVASPNVFFSPSRYVFEITVVCLAAALVTAGVWGAGALVAWLAHRFLPRHATMLLLLLGLLLVALAGAAEVGVNIRVPRTLVVWATTWCFAAAFFHRRHFQLFWFLIGAAFPLLVVLDQGNTARFFVLGAVLGALVWGAERYARKARINNLLVDVAGITLFPAIVLQVVVHIWAPSFVWALDAPFLVGWLGLLLVAVGALLGARPPRPGRMRGDAIGVASLGILLATGGYFWSQAPVPASPQRADASQRPDIALIVWDTVRAQQLGCYGYEGATSPFLDDFARKGVLFERAVAPAPWTLPSHASMFTGKYPRSHGAWYGGYLKLAAEHDTLAELLSESGYQTVGLVANSSVVCAAAGLDQGFHDFYEVRQAPEHVAYAFDYIRRFVRPHDDGGIPVRRALQRWLMSRRDRAKPLFLFVNLVEAHDRYAPARRLTKLSGGVTFEQAVKWAQEPIPKLLVDGPGNAQTRDRAWQALSELYDAEIRYVDETTRDLLAQLEGSGSGENLLTIITADHGESLGEHDSFNHLFSLRETLLHVPLVMNWPGKLPSGHREAAQVSSMDLFATVAAAGGLEASTWRGLPSQDLVAMSRARTFDRHRTLVSETYAAPMLLDGIGSRYQWGTPGGRFCSHLLALYDGPWKYMTSQSQGAQRLYNVLDDPGETHDRSKDEPGRVADMARRLDAWLATTPHAGPLWTDGYEKGPLK